MSKKPRLDFDGLQYYNGKILGVILGVTDDIHSMIGPVTDKADDISKVTFYRTDDAQVGTAKAT